MLTGNPSFLLVLILSTCLEEQQSHYFFFYFLFFQISQRKFIYTFHIYMFIYKFIYTFHIYLFWIWGTRIVSHALDTTALNNGVLWNPLTGSQILVGLLIPKWEVKNVLHFGTWRQHLFLQPHFINLSYTVHSTVYKIHRVHREAQLRF